MQNLTLKSASNQEQAVISKAVSNASDYWDISNIELSQILGLSPSTVSRFKKGQYHIQQDSKNCELALLFLRIFRGLDAYMGGHIENEKAWLRAYNKALKGAPLELMKNVQGLSKVTQYIDYIRGQ